MIEREALQTMLRLWDQHCGLWAVREQVNDCRNALAAEPSDEDVGAEMATNRNVHNQVRMTDESREAVPAADYEKLRTILSAHVSQIAYLVAERDDLRARLAAAEQERDSLLRIGHETDTKAIAEGGVALAKVEALREVAYWARRLTHSWHRDDPPAYGMNHLEAELYRALATLAAKEKS